MTNANSNRCFICGNELIFDAQFDFIDYGIYNEDGVVSVLHCINKDCNTEAMFFTSDNKEGTHE